MLVQRWYNMKKDIIFLSGFRGRLTLVNLCQHGYPYQQFTNIEVGNMPKNAVLCRIEALGVMISESGINLAKLGILPHRKAFKNNDKNPIRLPRHTMRLLPIQT